MTNSSCKLSKILDKAILPLQVGQKKHYIVLSAKIYTTLLVGHFMAISGHCFANYIIMFQKTEVLTVILGANLSKS